MASHSRKKSKKLSKVIPVGVTPNGIAITPNGKWAYVANNNNYSLSGQDTVTVIELSSRTVYKTIKHKSFNEPYTVTINSNGTLVYVTNSGGSTVSVINTSLNKVVKVIEGFDGPSGFAIHGHFGYVNNYGATPGVGSGNGDTVSIIDLNTHKIFESSFKVGLAPAAIKCDSKNIYTINYVDGNPNTGTISKINPETLSVTTIGPFKENGLSGPFGIVIRKKMAYVTNFGSNNFTPVGTTVSVIDLAKECVVETIDVGIQPSGISIYKGKYLAVSNYNTLYADISGNPVQYNNLTPGQGTVSIIHIKKCKVITTVETGQSPANIAIDNERECMYVTNYTGGTVSVIELRKIIVYDQRSGW